MRGTSRRSAISPKWSPSPSVRTALPSTVTSSSPERDDVEAVARLALPHNGVPGRDVHRPELVREVLQLGRRERCEDRDPAQQIEALGRPERGVDRGQAPPGEDRRAPGGRHRTRSAPRASRARSRAPARGSHRPPSRRQSRLSTTPKTRPRISSGTARWSSVGAATSTMRVPHSHEGEEDERRCLAGEDADEDERRAPEQRPDGEVGGEPLPRDEEDRRTRRRSSPPTPNAEFRYPTPALPKSSSWIEATTTRTPSAPATSV